MDRLIILTVLKLKAYHGHRDIIHLLLRFYPDVNIKEEKGKTPLYLAKRRGHDDCVELLQDRETLDAEKNSMDPKSPTICYSAHCEINSLIDILVEKTTRIQETNGKTDIQLKRHFKQ